MRDERLSSFVELHAHLLFIVHYYVPLSQEAKYFSCSSVRVSMFMPIERSLRRAISWSSSCGMTYTFASSCAAFLTMYSAARAWLAKLMSITLAGCPSAAARFTRRPSARR